MTTQPPSPTSPAILAPYDPTGRDADHQRCYNAYVTHAQALATATVGNGLPTLADLTTFINSVQTRPNLNTAPATQHHEPVWVAPTCFVATPSYMTSWPAPRYKIGGFLNRTQHAGLDEHATGKLWGDTTAQLVAMAPDGIEMSVQGNDLYMRLGAGGRHRWAAWTLLGFSAVPVLLVS